MSVFDDLGPPKRSKDPFADLGPPVKAEDPFADLAPPVELNTTPDAFGIVPREDAGAGIVGAGASFVDLSTGIVKSLAGGLNAAAAIPQAIFSGEPELVPQAFERVAGALPMDPVWNALLPEAANLEREKMNEIVGEMATLPTLGGKAGEAILEKTGSPEAAAIAATLVQAIPILGAGAAGRKLLKGAKAAGEAIVADIPQETLYKPGKKTVYKRADLQRILTEDPAADPVLLERVKTDPAFRRKLVDSLRKGDLSVEELHPNWLGEILGKEPITTETPTEPAPPAAPVAALPPPGDMAMPQAPEPAPVAPTAPPAPAGGPKAADLIQWDAFRAGKGNVFRDRQSAVDAAEGWRSRGVDVQVATVDGGPAFHPAIRYTWKLVDTPPDVLAGQKATSDAIKGIEKDRADLSSMLTELGKKTQPTAPDPFTDLPPVAPEGTAPPTVEVTPTPQAGEIPSTVPSPGPAAGAEPPFAGPDRRKAPQVGPRERRVDLAERKRIDDMTPEERATALRIDEPTGLRSKRAFQEDEGPVGRQTRVALDMNGLKWINDTLGHSVGDTALRAVAEAIREGHGEGYRISGDEMAILAETPAAAKISVARIRDVLGRVEVEAERPDGTVARFKGLTITAGIGGDLDEAFDRLNEDKIDAIRRGERSEERGGRPPRLLEVPTRGDEIPVSAPAAEITPGTDRDKEVSRGPRTPQEIVPREIQKDDVGPQARGDAEVDEGAPAPRGDAGAPAPSGGTAPQEVGQPRLPGMGKAKERERAPLATLEKLKKSALQMASHWVDPEKKEDFTHTERALLRLYRNARDMGFSPVEISNAINEEIVRLKWFKSEADFVTPEEVRKLTTVARMEEAKHRAVVAKKAPEEVTTPEPTRPFNERWSADRGAIPGEPSHFLDGETADDAKGILIERVSEQGTSSWDGYIMTDKGPLPVADRVPFETAAKKVQERVDLEELDEVDFAGVVAAEARDKATSTNSRGISDPEKRDKLLAKIGLKLGEVIEFKWTAGQEDWGKTTVVGVSDTKIGPVPITRPKQRHTLGPNDVLWDSDLWRKTGKKGKIEVGEGKPDGLESRPSGKPGTVPAGTPGDVAGEGDLGAVPREPGESGDRDVRPTEKKRSRKRPSRGTGDRLPVSEREGEPGGPVTPEVLVDVAQEAAEAPEEVLGLTPGKTDYVLTPEDVDFTGRGAKTRTRENIEAIKLAMQLSAENRLATPEEQKILVRYSGWGGLSDAFHGANYKPEWAEIRREIYDLLDTPEYEAARNSILNAHYTSIDVVDAMWSAIQAAGFKSGRVLEPGAGIGNFLMRTPLDVKAKTRFTAVELDLISGTILKQLNQSQDVRVQGYQDSKLSDNFYDVAISNVPFVETPILSDPRFIRQKFVLHDYYFAKTLDKVRPGGLIAFITSRYTMDKKDPKIRDYIAERADLLGAIRLPRTAFKANAATEVVTDIIFLKRRPDGAPAAGQPFKELKSFGTDKGSTDINEYFLANPQNVLGRHSFTGSMYAKDEYTVEPVEEISNLGEAIRARAVPFTAGAYEPRKIGATGPRPARTEIQLEGISTIPDYSFLIKDGKVYQRQGDKLVEVASSTAAVKRYRTFIDLGNAARALVTNQLDPEYTDEQFNKDRGALNRLYDAATKGNVRLAHKSNQQMFGEDPNWNLIRALEIEDRDAKTFRKADILTKRVVFPSKKIEAASSPRDALAISLRETGTIDLSRIASLLGTSEGKAWEAIRGDAFQAPDGTLEIRDKYLSGNVRKKLAEAEAAANVDPRFEPNVEALKGVIPEDVPPGDIYVNFGASWIAPNFIDDFVSEVLQDNVTTSFFPGTATWGVDRVRGYRPSSNVALLHSTYGTQRIDAIDILTLSLNQQSPRIYDTVYEDGVEKRVLNAPATLEAKARQADLKAKFQEWVWQDEARAKALHRAYNDIMNAFVEPKHDGVKIYTVDGRTLVPGQNTEITLRDTQINAMWRALIEGNTLLWHEVGTGKTFIMAALAKELRRTGAAQKPVIVVPKVIFGQIQRNFITLFPDAKILAPSMDDFKPANRKRFLYRIATGDWDAVILTKEHLQKIPPPVDVENELIREAIDELELAIAAEGEKKKAAGRRSPTMRQLLKLLDRLKEQLKALANVKRDEETLAFNELGIDYMMVDESHYFKNLRYTTRMNGVAGMGNPAGNKRSWDLYVKTTYLNRMTKNRGVLLSTGTPISNSIAELYTIQRYLSPDLLRELNIAAFDSWAATFASVETGYEITVDGGYKAKDRFSEFNNMPELSTMVRQVADTVTADMAGVKRPTADRITVEAPASEEYLAYQDAISARAEAIKARRVTPKEDNFPKLSTDGRHAALDIRLRVPAAPDYPDSKVNKIVDRVFDEWKKGKADRRTQLVFMDLGVEKEGTDEVRTYADLKAKLLKRGVPPSELAVIQDKKYDTEDGRLALYEAVNDGRVRILIGSTSKMSEGMNVQKRLVALHHADPTWTPAGIMQREGRILRQGNENETVRIYTYLTTGRGGKASFDAFMWQLMEAKAGPITELQTNATPARTVGDVGGIYLNAAEWKAISTGNPLVVEKVKLQDELNRLNALAGQHQAAQMNIPYQIDRILRDVEETKERIALANKDIEILAAHPDKDVVTLGGKDFDLKGGEGQKERMEAVSSALSQIYEKVSSTDPALSYESRERAFRKIGSYRGYEIRAAHYDFKDRHGKPDPQVSIRMNMASSGHGMYGVDSNLSPEGGDGLRFRGMLERATAGMGPEHVKTLEAEAARRKEGAEALKKEQGKPFKDQKRLTEVQARLAQVNSELGITQEKAADEIAATIDQEEVLLDEEKKEPPTDDGPKLYASPLDPELIAQAWRSLKQSTEELRERHRLAKSAKGLDLLWFNRKVNTPFFIFSEKFPKYRGVFERMRQMMQERDDIASTLAAEALPFFSGLEFKEKEAVNKLLIRGRFERKVWTRAELKEEGKLTDKQIDAYLGIRKMLDHALDIYEDGIIYRVTKGKIQASSNLSMDILRDALSQLGYSDDTIARVGDLIQRMRDTKRAGYAPFSRFGDFAYGYVHATEDGLPDWQNPNNYFAKEETAWKAAEKYQALLKRFRKGIEEGRLIPVPPKELKQSEKAALLQDIGGFELDVIQKLMRIDTDAADSLKDAVEQFFQEQGFRKHFFESKDSPGFSTDMERSLADYIVSLSGFVSKIKGLPEMDALAKGMEKHPELAMYYRNWRQYSISPQEEFHQIRAGLFLYFLGGNVKSAAINLTQTLVTTVPWLAQYVSPHRAMAEVTRAVKDLTAAMGKREDGTYGVVIDKLPKEIRGIVRKAYNEGIISEQMVYELMGAAHRPSALRKLSKKKQRIVRGFGFLFSLAEKSNRLVALVAAARIHQSIMQKAEAAGGGKGAEPPKKPPGGPPFEDDAFEFGKRAVDESQFIYAKYNRPEMFRGWGSLLGTFRTYVINFLEHLARLWNRKSLKAVAATFVMLWGFAGLIGLPFAENVKFIIEEITGMVTHRKPDIETAAREWGYENMGGPEFMDYLIHGPFRHATGFDIGASVGSGDIIPFFDRNFQRAPIETMIGAPAEVFFKRPGRAYGLLKEGDTYRAVETIAPEFLRNPMYAARILREGVLDRSGGQIVSKEKISAADVAKKALGFMPTEIAKAHERDLAKSRIGERSEQVKRDATRSLVNAIRIGDKEKALSILRNTGPKPGVPPEEWIVIDEKSVEKQLENVNLPPELRGLLRQPNLQRPAYLRMNKLYGGK